MNTPVTVATARQLEAMELFVGLSAEALTEVGVSGRVRHLPSGTMLFGQGARADQCHAVLAGRIRITQSGEEGGQLVVRFVGPGEMFGTVALFTDRRYPAEAVAVVDSVEVSWSEEALLALIRRYPPIALNLVRVLGTRLGEVQERLRELATQRVDQRIAHALVRLSGRERRQSEDGMSAVIDFPLTRQDVAQMCGATLYTASRILTAWERAGYIATERRRIVIHDLAAIRRLAGESLNWRSR